MNQKPDDGAKVESVAGVEEQPEGTAVTGRHFADSKDTATAPAKMQQHEQHEHHRLIDPGSNGGDCGFRAFALHWDS